MKHLKTGFKLAAALVFALTLLTGCQSSDGGGPSASGGVYYGVGFYDPWYHGGYGYYRPGMIRPPPPNRPVVPMNPSVRPPSPPPRPMPSIPSMPRPATRR
jgi:hypothetical protein